MTKADGMNGWVTPPFEPEPEERRTMWYDLGIPTVPSGVISITPLQDLVDATSEKHRLAPELIEPPRDDETYRFALRRLTAMADNKAACVSMRTELYWVYRIGKRAGYKTGEIKEHCAAILAKWRGPQPPREAIR